jgi:hypothetical protein
MKKNVKWMIAMVAITAAMMGSFARATIIYDKAWEGGKDPRTATPPPNVAGWSMPAYAGSTVTNDTVNGWTIVSPTTAGSGVSDRIWRMSGVNWDPLAATSQDSAIEFRMKVASITGTGGYATAFGVTLGSQFWTILFKGDRLFENNQADALTNPVMVDTTAWNTYRIEMVKNTNKIDFYVNDVKVTPAGGWACGTGATGVARIDVGENRTDTAGTITYDYVRWTTNTTLVPEPATLAILSCGVAFLRTRFGRSKS